MKREEGRGVRKGGEEGRGGRGGRGREGREGGRGGEGEGGREGRGVPDCGNYFDVIDTQALQMIYQYVFL